MKNHCERTVGYCGRTGLTGSGLKWIALATMYVDHFAAVIAGPWLGVSEQMYLVLRGIGRLAFPIFCFLLVEGYHYTHSKRTYALRLFAFALLSEIPFDLAIHGVLLEGHGQNVFFTLCIGLLTIWGVDVLWQRQSTRVEGVLLPLVCVVAGMLVAEVLHTDYGTVGVLAIVLMYLGNRRSGVQGMTYGCVALLLSSWLELVALVDVALIRCYNGQRGRQRKGFFYVFYPAHLFLLYVLARLLTR